jgi:hypothetical protein
MAGADSLARLNYFNGQRLEATDLKTEQSYHVDVRRRLTKALFTPGIAAGLEVTKSATSTHGVIISPGVAIDNQGREIILLEAKDLLVVGAPAPLKGVAFGNFVAIEYGEDLTTPVLSGCTPRGVQPARGAPSRIVLDPRILFLDRWPSEESGRIVLAQVELAQNCVVTRINTGVRRYVAAAKPPATRPITLEGEKDIDAANPKILHFHIEGDYPSSAQLYLFATKFSSLFYTEQGRHSHGLDLRTGDTVLALRHSHTAQAAQTDESGEHTHNYHVDAGQRSGGIDVNQNQVAGRINTDTSALLPAGKHTHNVAGLVLDQALEDGPHNHAVSGGTGNAGVTDAASRAGQALGYVDDLRVVFDGLDITPQILVQLSAKPGQAGDWAKLGDGTPAHRLASSDGTGLIDLVQLGVVDLSPGKHELRFVVAAGGGQLQYNLYLG